MSKEEIIEALVYDTIVNAERAKKARDIAKSAFEAAKAEAQQADLAADLMASAFGIDVALLRAKANDEAAI